MRTVFPICRRIALPALTCLFMVTGGISRSDAHPHIFADARLEVETGADGKIEELRNVWRFDEVFSSSVVIDFDKNKNAKLDPDELAEVAQTVANSLEEFDYFVSLIDNGKSVSVNRPEHMAAQYDDGLLMLIFAVKPKQDVSLKGTVSVGIYDPTFYTAIDFANDGDLVVTGASAGNCPTRVVRPDPDQIISQNQSTLVDGFFNDPTSDPSKLFATRIELDCK